MWQEHARCLNHADPDIFYPPRKKGEYQDQADKARQVCFGASEDEGLCPVIVECLLFALQHNEVLGIWGGLSSRERSGLRTRLALPHWLTPEDTDTAEKILHAISHQIRSIAESNRSPEVEDTVSAEVGDVPSQH